MIRNLLSGILRLLRKPQHLLIHGMLITIVVSILCLPARLVGFYSIPTGVPPGWIAHNPIIVRIPPINDGISPLVISGLSPMQIRKAYGIDLLGSKGAGKTIAIVDAYGDPNIAADLAEFDLHFGLPLANLNIVYSGGTPKTNHIWAEETALDVEWAHAIAPAANILLVVAGDASFAELFNAIYYATATGPNVISMSWGAPEWQHETDYDYYFNNPGITYVASSGDEGEGVNWPAVSPYVVGVGGTTLTLDSNGTYGSESAWSGSAGVSGSGGGTSNYETEPSYQISFQSSGHRQVPDVAFDADPQTGVAVYYNGWIVVGGTSVSAPCWAGLFVLGGLSGVNSVYSQASTNALYSSNYHDITVGSNGLPAGIGYDEVTGLGSPKANAIVPGNPLRLNFITQPSVNNTAGVVFTSQPTIAILDANGNTVTASTVDVTLSITPGTGTDGAILSGIATTSAIGGLATFNGLNINKTGNDYTLTATSYGLVSTISAPLTVVAGLVSQLSISGYESPAVAGMASTLTVTALDNSGNTITNYVGMVQFTSNDAQAVLPVNYTFVSGDNGTHIFSATLKTAGNESISVTDTGTGSITGIQSGIIVSPAGTSQINVETAVDGSGELASAQNIETGKSYTFYAVTRDPYHNFVSNVAGSWSLVNRTGGVADSDLVVAQDNKSAVFTGNLVGTAAVQVTLGSLMSNPSGILTVISDSITDFDGDLKTDVSIYRPSTGDWYVNQSSNGQMLALNWGGVSGDIPVPGDYEGVGKADVGIYRPSTGYWYIRQQNGQMLAIGWGGVSGDIPVPGDYEGVGKTDIAIYRPSTGDWFIRQQNGQLLALNWGGVSGDIPVPGDYEGVGKIDIGIYRPSTGYWYIRQQNGQMLAIGWGGVSGDIPVVGDYDGDGKTDAAIYRPSTGYWYINQSSNGQMLAIGWGGVLGDVPVAGDYEGVGKTDIAIYRPSNGYWYIRQQNGQMQAIGWGGVSGDIPLPGYPN